MPCYGRAARLPCLSQASRGLRLDKKGDVGALGRMDFCVPLSRSVSASGIAVGQQGKVAFAGVG